MSVTCLWGHILVLYEDQFTSPHVSETCRFPCMTLTAANPSLLHVYSFMGGAVCLMVNLLKTNVSANLFWSCCPWKFVWLPSERFQLWPVSVRHLKKRQHEEGPKRWERKSYLLGLNRHLNSQWILHPFQKLLPYPTFRK